MQQGNLPIKSVAIASRPAARGAGGPSVTSRSCTTSAVAAALPLVLAVALGSGCAAQTSDGSEGSGSSLDGKGQSQRSGVGLVLEWVSVSAPCQEDDAGSWIRTGLDGHPTGCAFVSDHVLLGDGDDEDKRLALTAVETESAGEEALIATHEDDGEHAASRQALGPGAVVAFFAPAAWAGLAETVTMIGTALAGAVTLWGSRNLVDNLPETEAALDAARDPVLRGEVLVQINASAWAKAEEMPPSDVYGLAVQQVPVRTANSPNPPPPCQWGGFSQINEAAGTVGLTWLAVRAGNQIQTFEAEFALVMACTTGGELYVSPSKCIQGPPFGRKTLLIVHHRETSDDAYLDLRRGHVKKPVFRGKTNASMTTINVSDYPLTITSPWTGQSISLKVAPEDGC
jgi:hypothetical protein